MLKIFLMTSALLLGVVGTLTQPQAAENEVFVGPIGVTQSVNGVTVGVQIGAYFSVVSDPDGLHLNARIEADLHDLQTKFGSIIDTFPLPHNNCGSYKPDNLVVDLPTKSLTADTTSAHANLSGKVDVWTCLENPVPNSKVEWEIRKIGPVKTKVPKVVTWKGDPIKNKTLTQPFDFTVPVSVEEVGDRTLRLVIGDPKVELKGQYAFITKGILEIAGVNVNDEIKKALDKAIDPTKLSFVIPTEYADLHPVITSAKLSDNSGRLTLASELSAQIPAEKVNEFVLALVKHSGSN
jgi:hypothetical protein